MRAGSIALLACAAVSTIVAGAAFGTGLAHRANVRAAQSVSSALPVSRRVDPSLDRYMWTERARTPLRRMTSAQRWLAARAQPLVAHDSDPRVSQFIAGWERAPRVSVYVNATGVNLYDKVGLREAAPWLMRKGRELVRIDGWAMLDIRQPAARRWWLYGADGKVNCPANRGERGALDLIHCGYRGLWLDNLLTRPNVSFTPSPGIDDAAWGAGLVSLLRELREALPEGVPFTVNAHWDDVDFPSAASPQLDPAAPHVQLAALADQVILEGGAIDAGIRYSATDNSPWSYRRLLAYADAMHGAGAKLQWEKTDSTPLTSADAAVLGQIPNCRDASGLKKPAWRRGDATWRAHVRSAAFNTATALLTMEPGDGVGDMCEYPGRGWRGYGVDLGPPLGPRSDGGSVISRAFASGLVAVNPTTKALKVTLPEGRRGINLASTEQVNDDRVSSTFSLPARAALVITYAG